MEKRIRCLNPKNKATAAPLGSGWREQLLNLLFRPFENVGYLGKEVNLRWKITARAPSRRTLASHPTTRSPLPLPPSHRRRGEHPSGSPPPRRHPCSLIVFSAAISL
ncbi:hypothetical protein GUJ93_ZPchr0001g31882 [Zizania palustris]|uniref:Uncharacterized protein n=1 Tax=Zizania palustris TaxID=103762 RepID=A0A8J5RTB6_ZIZPA|nr:hypothetical protein GUJ93_ZPchr0001g31882 [Zizania palustris]